MEKNKKTIWVLIGIIVILLIAISIYCVTKSKNTNEEIGKLKKYYEKLENTDSYNFNIFLDDKNNSNYSKKENKAYIETNYEGNNFKYIVKDGNTYLIKDTQRCYYTYNNNETDLYKIELQITDIKDNEASTGKEKIEGKQYKYEEFKGLSKFYIGVTRDIETKNIKTRFYFDGDNLVYIKTIIDEKTEQLLKVNFSNVVDDKLFDIPSNYKDM